MVTILTAIFVAGCTKITLYRHRVLYFTVHFTFYFSHTISFYDILLQTILGNLKILRAATSRVGKEYAARGSNSTTAQEAKDILLEGMAELEQLYEHSVRALGVRVILYFHS